MYRVWCEYDIGQDYVVFSEEEKALEWAAAQLAHNDLSYDDALSDGLLSTEKLEVDPYG